MNRINRRQLLIATGLASGGLLLPSAWPRSARAQAGPIKRLLIMTSTHGTVREQWWMRRGNPEYQNWEYPFDDPDPESFSPILRDLHPHRERLLVLEGLAQTSTLGDRAINNHDAAHQHLLTGAQMVDDYNAGGPSVDQIVARAIARPDRIPSLELSAGRHETHFSFVNSAPSQKIGPEWSPRAVFDRLFPTGTPDTAAEPSERDLIRRARRNVLSLVRDEYEQVARRLGSDDRRKLEMHRDLVDGLAQRIDALVGLQCEAPDAPSDAGLDLVETGKLMGDLIAAAFACDLTRVATLQIGELENEDFGAPPGGDVHADIAHQTSNDPEAARLMTEFNRRHTEILAHVLDRLAAYQDGDGTLLDNSVAVWLTECAIGPHDLDKIPVVMAGSAGGYFRTGRYISYANDIPNPHEFPIYGPETTRPIGPGHSHLLISLMQAMGLPNNEIGMTSVVTRDGNGTVIDLTGPLPRLT